MQSIRPGRSARRAARLIRLFLRFGSSAGICAFLASGCGSDKAIRHFENTPPEIRRLVAVPDTLFLADTATVICEVYDPNPDPLAYRWTATKGRFIERGPTLSQVYWIAPDETGKDTVEVSVFDQTDSVRASVEIRVLGAMGTLNGAVLDDAGGHGIEGARVEIAGRVALSDSAGVFAVTRIPPGLDTLHVTHPDYTPFRQELFIQEGENAVNVRLSRVQPSARLHGIVRNVLEHPIATASCHLEDLEVSTDSTGAYDFAQAPLGRQVLLVQAPGYLGTRDTLEIVEPEVAHDVLLHAEVPAAPQGSLTVAKLENFQIRITWTPSNPPETIIGYSLHKIENGGSPEQVPAVSFDASGGTRTIGGQEDHRYKFAVAGINLEGQGGFGSDYTPVVVLTLPSPLVSVPAGRFVMGDYPSGYGTENHPGNPVQVEAFRIETHEVTNRQYLAYLLEAYDRGELEVTATEVRSGGNVLLLFQGSQIDPAPLEGGFSVVPERENYPVNGVTWFGADAYARQVGRRLPTEAEWEKTARGVVDSTGTWPGTPIGVGAPYPWGIALPTAQRANYGRFFGAPRPVGSFPAGAALWWGAPIYDLAGNVWEWCQDWVGVYANPHQPPITGAQKILRGGSWWDGDQNSAPELRTGHRWSLEPAQASSHIGFRCTAD